MITSTSRTRTPTNLFKVATTICQKSLFFATTLVMPNFQLATMFRLTIIVCEDGDTIRMLTTLIDESRLVRAPHGVPKANHLTHI
jgi:hypothetical protein